MRMIPVLPKRPSFEFAPAVVERDSEWPGAIAYCFGGNMHIGPRRFDSRRQWMLWQAARRGDGLKPPRIAGMLDKRGGADQGVTSLCSHRQFPFPP